MRPAWLTVAVATTAVGGVAALFLARRRVRELEGSASAELEPPPAMPSEKLPSGLNESVVRWVADLTKQTPPPPETVTAALLFADQLAAAGYPATATNIRETVNQIVGTPSPQSPSGEAEDEGQPTGLWADHYIGGWQTTPDNVQMVVRDAFDHLRVLSDGWLYVKPSEWDTLQAGENADELDRLGFGTLAQGLRDLIQDAQHLPESPP